MNVPHPISPQLKELDTRAEKAFAESRRLRAEIAQWREEIEYHLRRIHEVGGEFRRPSAIKYPGETSHAPGGHP